MLLSAETLVIRGYLYDADGGDREVSLSADSLPKLEEHHLLWVDVCGRDPNELHELIRLVQLEAQVLEALVAAGRSPRLDDYEHYFHCAVIALGATGVENKSDLKSPKTVRLDFVVGRNWLVTVADEELSFLRDFRDQDRGQTLIGALTSASLAASLLDWHLSEYLAGFERLEAFVDMLDMRMLTGRNLDRSLLSKVVAGRRFIGTLRRSLGPQRSIFYGLSRPDFLLIARSDAAEHFKTLAHHFERAVDGLEHSRELLQGSFDLFATRIAESTNGLVRRITLFSIGLGAIGAVAGVFGMNFQTPYTESGVTGFWIVVGSLLAFAAILAIISKWRNWI